MKVFTVVGNRPQFVKAAPLSAALREAGAEEIVLHTGQHWYHTLSQVFFDQLGLAQPSHGLGLHTSDPEVMQPAIAERIAADSPDIVLVYGDTNSTLAGARAAADVSIPLAHVEAGLRSGDLSMPEEHTRIETDRLAWLLFCPDDRSRTNLLAESVLGRVYVVGDVMADANRLFGPVARAAFPVPYEPHSYVVATVHRQANVEQPRLSRIVDGLNRIDELVVFPVHPRTRTRLKEERLALGGSHPAHRAAQLPRARVARVPGACDRDRLGRLAEGGVLVRRAVCDGAAVDGVGGHGRGRRKCARGRRSVCARAGGCVRRDAETSPGPVRRRPRLGADRTGARRYDPEPMKRDVAIVGAGYVGLPLARTFADAGKHVLLVDVDPERVAQLNAGESYIEDVPSVVLKPLVDAGLVAATSDYDALRDVDAILIALPTPLSRQREPDLRILVAAAGEIASRLRPGQLVVLESTTYPGTTREQVQPTLEAGSGLTAGKDFHLAFSPERVDPGREDWTMRNVTKVVGGIDESSTSAAAELYGAAIDNVHPVSSPEAAELTKLLENIFRSVNIALVNELAQLCERMDIDVWEVVEAAATKPFGFMSFNATVQCTSRSSSHDCVRARRSPPPRRS